MEYFYIRINDDKGTIKVPLTDKFITFGYENHETKWACEAVYVLARLKEELTKSYESEDGKIATPENVFK